MPVNIWYVFNQEHFTKHIDLRRRKAILRITRKAGLQNLMYSQNQRRLRLSGNVARMGEIRNLRRKTVGNKSLRKLTFKWEGSICSES